MQNSLRPILVFSFSLVLLIVPAGTATARGGGCFPAGTLIKTPGGAKPIEEIKSGDLVTAIAKNGSPVTVRVSSTYSTTSQLVVVRTRHGRLVTTDDHPLRFANGEFLPATEIWPGGRLSVWRKGRLRRTTVRDVQFLDDEADVYNLSVEEPNTFIADGFVVHNKGGGGGEGVSGRGGNAADAPGKYR